MRCSSATTRQTAAPRRIVTSLDGTADVRLRPGNYTVESDRPVAFLGKAYEWTQTLDIVAGRDAVLELTADNAEVEAVRPRPTSAAPLEADPSFLLTQWQDSVVALWTPTTHASGFVIDANGLIATNQRAIGTATAVEVQLTPAVKVAASVLVADPVRDVAVLWIDPETVASVRPVPLGCAQTTKPIVVDGQKIFAIGAPLGQQKGPASGTVSRVEAHAIVSDLGIASGGAGGPVFTRRRRRGRDQLLRRRGRRERSVNSRVVRVGDVCDAVAAAEKKMKDATPPNGTRLPVEPERPFPVERAQGRSARPRRQPEPVPDVLVRLRHRVHHAGADLRRAAPVGAAGHASVARGARTPALTDTSCARLRTSATGPSTSQTFRRCCWSA